MGGPLETVGYTLLARYATTSFRRGRGMTRRALENSACNRGAAISSPEVFLEEKRPYNRRWFYYPFFRGCGAVGDYETVERFLSAPKPLKTGGFGSTSSHLK